MPDTVSISSRFNGPLESGNGGYSSGLFAAFLDGPAEVSLRRPVPLDTPLDVVREDAEGVRVLDGEELVAEARAAAPLDFDVPTPVTAQDAREAATRYTGESEGIFSRCFVCGRGREDSFGVFAGEVEGRRLVASPWTPPSWTAQADGQVRPEFVWAVLDCPTAFALLVEGRESVGFLARMSARIDAPIAAGEEHVVIGWPVGSEGRKHHARSAVLSPEGRTLAVAQALMIEPRR